MIKLASEETGHHELVIVDRKYLLWAILWVVQIHWLLEMKGLAQVSSEYFSVKLIQQFNAIAFSMKAHNFCITTVRKIHKEMHTHGKNTSLNRSWETKEMCFSSDGEMYFLVFCQKRLL